MAVRLASAVQIRNTFLYSNRIRFNESRHMIHTDMPSKARAGSDLHHNFPHFSPLSRLIPGPERIRENILVDKPITGPPCGTVTTIYEAMDRGSKLSNNAPLFGQIQDGKYEWTDYNTVIRDAKVLGSAMLANGQKPSGLVGIAGIQSVRYLTAMHGMVAYSMTIVPLYHNSKLDSLCEIVDNCGLSLVFCDSDARAAEFVERRKRGQMAGLETIVVLNPHREYHGAVEGIADMKVLSYDSFYKMGEATPSDPVPPKPDDIYLICHTSGTTGRPKGVMLSHRSLLAAMGGLYRQWVPPPNKFVFDHNDTYFSFLSLAHVYEHLMQAFTIYIGGRVGIYSGDVTKLVADIQKVQPTILSLVPRLLNKFHDHIHAEVEKKNVLAKILFQMAKRNKIRNLHRGEQRYDTVWDTLVFNKLRPLFGGRLRMITTGGAPVTTAVKDFTRIAYGCPLMEGYGQTECGAAGTLNLPFEYVAGVVGGPAPWAQVKLVDVPEMNYWAKEDKGEIWFRGAAVMTGYYGDDELTKKTVDEEGWLHTGDIGQWTTNGALAVIDRKNALFKLAQGDFVSPEQIEAVYLNCGLITQLFVTGRTTRSFLVGIGVVNLAALRKELEGLAEYAKQSASSDAELVSDPAVVRLVMEILNAVGKQNGLQTIELIKALSLTTEEWTAEASLVTPTLKLRRHLLKEKYEKEIEVMYEAEKNI